MARKPSPRYIPTNKNTMWWFDPEMSKTGSHMKMLIISCWALEKWLNQKFWCNQWIYPWMGAWLGSLSGKQELKGKNYLEEVGHCGHTCWLGYTISKHYLHPRMFTTTLLIIAKMEKHGRVHQCKNIVYLFL